MLWAFTHLCHPFIYFSCNNLEITAAVTVFSVLIIPLCQGVNLCVIVFKSSLQTPWPMLCTLFGAGQVCVDGHIWQVSNTSCSQGLTWLIDTCFYRHRHTISHEHSLTLIMVLGNDLLAVSSRTYFRFLFSLPHIYVHHTISFVIFSFFPSEDEAWQICVINILIGFYCS